MNVGWKIIFFKKGKELMVEIGGLQSGDSEEEEDAPVGAKGKWCEIREDHVSSL